MAEVSPPDPPPPSDPTLTVDDYDGLAIPPLDPSFLSQGLPGCVNLDHLDEEGDDAFLEGLDFDAFLEGINFDEFLADTEGDIDNDPKATPYSNSNSSSPEPELLQALGDERMDGFSVDRGQDDCEYLNTLSPESKDSKPSNDSRILDFPSPESQGSGNCRSDVSDNAYISANRSPDSGNVSVKNVSAYRSINLEELSNDSSSSIPLLKRKKAGADSENTDSRNPKFQKSNSSVTDNADNSSGNNEILGEEDEKKRARLMRNRESAQLSRQRKKQYVEELEDKVRNMGSTIQDLNARIAYIMSENATLRQQLGAGGMPPPPIAPPAPGMYPPQMMYPWMPYSVPPYMVKSQGLQVPLVPIPRLKPQQAVSAPKSSKKLESKKKEAKTKKVASVSFLGLLFFILLFGGLVPMVNVRYGGTKEAFGGASEAAGHQLYGKHHHERVFEVSRQSNGTHHPEKYGGRREVLEDVPCGRDHGGGEMNIEHQLDDQAVCNGSQPLAASLYVPRNDKLVKIDGNLIIHSFLASEKAMSSREHPSENVSSETRLAVPGDLAPAVPVSGGRQASLNRNPSDQQRALGFDSVKDSLMSTAADGTMHQWFQEGLAGPLLSSGMCTEVFQFDVSSAIVPASPTRNVSMEQGQNSTHLSKLRNRRILHGLPASLPKASHNASGEPSGKSSQKENFSGNNSTSSMVVSVLVDPREVADMEGKGVMGPKSLSRIFVVVLLDSVKYVTYSCMLPFKGTVPHLVTT